MTEQFIEWHPSEHGGPLGRHVQHDEQSRQYAFTRTVATPKSVTHKRISPVLDQDLSIVFLGQTYNGTGSCTGNTAVGVMGSDPIFDTPSRPTSLDEGVALTIYSAATNIDGFGAPWPTNDRGSSGLAVAKVCQKAGYISGYQHCFSLNAMIQALQVTPVLMGTNWYDSMDKPGVHGVSTISAGASIRGGHEYECIGVDVENRMFEFVNSWGTGWGLSGHFFMTYDDVTRLLGEQGDVTVFTTKVPAKPEPTPTPTPVTPTPDDVDKAMWQSMQAWAKAKGFV